MAYQKLQVSRGLVVIPSDTVDIPFPGAEITSGTTTAASAGKLIESITGTNTTDTTTLTDAAKDFTALGVKVGDTVTNTTVGTTTTTVTAVGVTTLTLEVDIFPSAGQSYSIGKFIRTGIKIGDIVYADVAATVTAIDSATQLSVTTAVATTTAYKIYTPGKNSGCVLYVGTTGNIKVITAGGDTVLFTAVPVGMFMPVEVTRVMFTGTVGSAAIVALW